MKPVINENCSCLETCCPSSKESDNDIKNLLRVCFSEWIVMGILAMMIMMKMETYLNDDEWVWYMICSTMLFVFSLPFTVGFHDHTTPRCNCHGKESNIPSPIPIITSRSSKKEPEFGLIKKVKDALGFGVSSGDESSEEFESFSTGSFVEKLKRKSKAQKRNKKTNSKKKSKSIMRNVEKSTKKRQMSVSTLTNISSESESLSSSTKVSLMKPEIGIIEVDPNGFGVIRKNDDESLTEESGEKLSVVLVKNEEPKPTTVVIEEEIFKGSDAENEEKNVEAKLMMKKEPSLHGEAANFEYNLIVDDNPDEDDNMIVDVHSQVEGREMTVSTHAANEGEGQAEVETEIKYGDKKDKGDVEIVVFSDASSSGDEMTLKDDK